jgi:hypothetical protein
MKYLPHDIARFEKYVQKSKNCWNWIGGLDKRGYGQFHIGGVKNRKNLKAHRASYEIYVGPLSRESFILHRCDNPRCVRPDHLQPGTNQENIRDMVRKGRSALAKIRPEQVALILHDLQNTKKLQREIGAQYGISQSMVSLIKLKKSWHYL